MLCYLKRVSGKHSRNKCINVILCSLQITTPVIVLLSVMVTQGQEPYLQLIIKNYGTILQVIDMDKKFIESLPDVVLSNAKSLNEGCKMKLTED